MEFQAVYTILWSSLLVGVALGIGFSALVKPRGWVTALYFASFFVMAWVVRPLIDWLVV